MFTIYIDFRSFYLYLQKVPSEILLLLLLLNSIKPVDQFGENWDLYNVGASNPWTWYIFSIYLDFEFFNQHFVIFTIQLPFLFLDIYLGISQFWSYYK